jgi:hypothetical protein
MLLPTQAQVNTGVRYAGTIAGTAFAIFGLQAKGFSLDQAKAAVGALGSVVNDVVILIGIAGPLFAAFKGVKSSSAAGQAAAIGANEKTVVNPGPNGTATVTLPPDMAQAALKAQSA